MAFRVIKPTKKIFVYNMLFVIPREVLHMVDSILFVLTFGIVHSGLYWIKVEEHVKWAINISNKFDKK